MDGEGMSKNEDLEIKLRWNSNMKMNNLNQVGS